MQGFDFKEIQEKISNSFRPWPRSFQFWVRSYQYLHWLQGPNCISTRAPSLQPPSLHRALGRHQLLSPEPPLLCHLRCCTGSSSPFKQSQPERIESSRPHLHASLDWFSDVQFVVWTKPDGSSICLPHRTFQTTKQTWLNFNILHTWPLRLVYFLFFPYKFYF